MPAAFGLASSDEGHPPVPVLWVARNRNGIPHQECRRGVPLRCEEATCSLLDRSHKGSHTAAVINRDEELVGELSVCADRRQRDRLLRWAAPFEPRLWAVEGATGTARCWRSSSSHQARPSSTCPPHCRPARLLDSGHKDKTDATTRASAAIVALRHRNLRAVTLEITDRSCDCWRVVITSSPRLGPGRSVGYMQCSPEMIEGGLSKNLSARRASVETRSSQDDR